MKERVKLNFQEQEIDGLIVNEDSNYLKVKLNNGYNLNLDKTRIEILERNKVEVEEKVSEGEGEVEDSGRPNIAILHTGGTIASKVDYNTGAVNAQFSPEELLNLFPELAKKADISTKALGNLFSEDFRFSHYNLILEYIEKVIREENVEGVIVSHGTDTMHYSAAALNYAMENLKVPVILVGAQRSSDRPSSDAYTNLNAAVDFIIENSKKEKKYSRVGICMHSGISDDEMMLIDGINSKKAHTSRRDAFKQLNHLEVARINREGEINILREELFKEPETQDLKINYFDENVKLGFFKSHPNVFPQEISNLSIYDAVVIEGTGLGHLGVDVVDESTKVHQEVLEELEKVSKNTYLIMASQCDEGEINLYVYSSGRKLLELGVYGNYFNLTPETMFARVAYILSRKEDFDELWNQDLEKLNN